MKHLFLCRSRVSKEILWVETSIKDATMDAINGHEVLVYKRRRYDDANVSDMYIFEDTLANYIKKFDHE